MQPKLIEDVHAMRIVIVLPGFARVPTGGYKIVYQYANWLVRRGHTVALLQMRTPKDGDATARPLQRAVRRLQYRLGSRRRPAWFALDPRVSVRNFSSITPGAVPDCDVLVATAVHTAELVAEQSAKRGCRGYYFLQHFEDYSAAATFVEQTWRLPLRKIVVSSWLQRLAVQLGEEAVLVRNSIDLDALPQGAAIAHRPRSVLAMVSAEPWKRTDLVCKVLDVLALRHPDLELRTFGTIPRPAGLPRGAAHTQRPSLPALSRLYRTSRVYLCTSDHEGFGLPVLEAMVSGCAVVSTDNDGVRSFAGDLVQYAPAGDANALASMISDLIDDESTCATIASRAAAAARQYSVWDAAEAFEHAISS